MQNYGSIFALIYLTAGLIHLALAKLLIFGDGLGEILHQRVLVVSQRLYSAGGYAADCVRTAALAGLGDLDVACFFEFGELDADIA